MIWALGTRVCRKECMNKLKNGDVVKTFVYNYMFIKGFTEEEALSNQEEKMIFSLEVCQPLLQASQDHVQCSHDRGWDKLTTLGWSYSGYHYCWMPSLQADISILSFLFTPVCIQWRERVLWNHVSAVHYWGGSNLSSLK